MKSLMDLVAAAKANISEIDATTLAARLEANDGVDLVLIDIREPQETAEGVIESALCIPRGVLEPAADLKYPKRHPVLSEARDKNVVMYCASGGRSALAADVLQQMGFQNVQSLAGGFENWIKEDRPRVKNG